jgi:hypothetical protein
MLTFASGFKFWKKVFLVILAKLSDSCENRNSEVFSFENEISRIFVEILTGTTNNFHIQSSSSLAILYNDKAVLENHHVAQFFRLGMVFLQCFFLSAATYICASLFRSL